MNSDTACTGVDSTTVEKVLLSGAVGGDFSDCSVRWLLVAGSEDELGFPEDSAFGNAVLVSEPLLGLLFLDSDVAGGQEYFLLDRRSRRVEELDLIASASLGAERDFSSSNLNAAVFAHYRQDWSETGGLSLLELREQVQVGLAAVFGSSTGAND